MDPALLRFSTPRLILRPVVPDDAEATARLVTPDVTRGLATWFSPMTPADALAHVEKGLSLQAQGRGFNLTLRRRSSETLMGWLGMWMTSGETARLGYWIGTEFRNAGYMTEALGHVAGITHQLLGAGILEAVILPENRASARVLEKLRFTFDGTEEGFMANRGRAEVFNRYRMLL